MDPRTRAMYERYLTGDSLADVGAAFGVSAPAVSARFRRAGLPTRAIGAASNARRARAAKSRERALEMYRMYETGKSSREVAEAFGVSQPRVTQIFQEHGLRMRSHGPSAATHSAQEREALENRNTHRISAHR